MEQAVFETHAALLAANLFFVLTDDLTPLTQARQGVENVIARLAVRSEPTRPSNTQLHGFGRSANLPSYSATIRNRRWKSGLARAASARLALPAKAAASNTTG